MQNTQYILYFFGIFTAGGISLMVGQNWILGGILLAIGVAGPIYFIVKEKRDRSLLSFDENIKKSKVVWGFWHTGGEEIRESHIQSGVIKRILLLKADDEESLKCANKITGLRNITMSQEQINDITKWVGTFNPDMLRHYRKPLTYTFTIFQLELGNSYDDESFEFSDDAWIVVRVQEPKVKNPSKRYKYLIKNKGKDKDRFEGYYKLYKETWDLAGLETNENLKHLHTA